MLRRVLVLALLMTMVSSARAGEGPKPIPGIGPVGPIRKLHGEFKFTEGPAADGKGNVYFTDIPATKINRWSVDGKLSVFTEASNRANGLMFDGQGRLFACEMAGQVVVWDVRKKTKKVLAKEYAGKPFNAPNDLVLDGHGGIYFTDPDFGAAKPRPQDATAVYYLSANGKLARVTSDLPKPNGVILSPDEKTLYVIPSGSADMLAYPVQGPGKLGEKKVFCTLKQPAKVKNTGGDGLTVDVKGNLYITSRLGLQVVNPSGKILGIIALPEVPANVTFWGEGNRHLFVTARTSIYDIPLEVAGHVFPGKK